MRVQTEKLMDAIHQLKKLHNQLSVVEDRIRMVQQEISRHSLGDPVATETILSVLRIQRKILDTRKENIEQLTRVLLSAVEQYEDCEEKNIHPIVFSAIKLFREQFITDYNPHVLIPRFVEHQVIKDYIMPLYVAGKQDKI